MASRATSSAAGAGGRGDTGPELNLVQLQLAKQQLDQEIELLANSVQQLQSAKNKFQESGDAVSRQKDMQKGADMLVPLTSSMYVEGRLEDPGSFFVDIGTGYFVEKNYASAVEYFNRKVKFLNEQIDNYLKITQEKMSIRDSIMEALQQRAMISQQMAAAAAAQAGAQKAS